MVHQEFRSGRRILNIADQVNGFLVGADIPELLSISIMHYPGVEAGVVMLTPSQAMMMNSSISAWMTVSVVYG